MLCLDVISSVCRDASIMLQHCLYCMNNFSRTYMTSGAYKFDNTSELTFMANLALLDSISNSLFKNVLFPC